MSHLDVPSGGDIDKRGLVAIAVLTIWRP